MNANFLELYELMVIDLKKILESDLPEKQKMEDCFRAAIGHWNEIKVLIKSEGFSSDEGEIHFFKNIKPRFTAEIEYYTLCYHALQFLPDGDNTIKAAFWSGELSRLEKFFSVYHDFISYCQEARSDKDNLYFLRRNTEENGLAPARVFDMDAETTTVHSSLLSILIGYTKYRNHVMAESEKCKYQ